MPRLPIQWNDDGQIVSMQPPASANPEFVIPLWWHSGAIATTTASTEGTKLAKGTTTMNTGTGTDVKLHTLNSAWSSTTKFSLEAGIYAGGGGTVNAALWDFTAGAKIASSQMSTAASTATVVRSAQFTLTPGRVYGVELWVTSGSGVITDASLIVFPQ